MLRFLKNMFGKQELPEEHQPPKSDESFWKSSMRQFRKNRLAVYSLRFIYCLVFIALIADFLANEKPIVAKYEGETYFPIFLSYGSSLGMTEWPDTLQNADWDELEFDWVVRPPIPYSPTNMDENNDQAVSPFADQDIPSNYWRHWLGTDELGHDILAGMIHGTRVALLVGIVAMSIAAFIGILLGSLAGYFGDNRLKISIAGMIINLVFLFFGFFYGFGSRGYVLADALENSFGLFFWEFFISILIIVGFMVAAKIVSFPFQKVPVLNRRIGIPMDIMVMRLVEIMISIPTLFLIISVIAIVQQPSLFLVMAIIGLTRWTDIARLTRGELLRIRSLEYIEAARALGYSEVRTILRHAIPNALSPVLIAIAFGIAASILIESMLSFLGLTPADVITWGSLLSDARQDPSSWWLAIFPGFAIFLTVTVYNLVGEGLTDAFDPKQRK